MKKVPLILFTLPLAVILSSCTLPWQKSSTPETETVIENGINNEDTISGTDTPEPAQPVDITPSDTPKAIAEGGVYLPYTTTAVAQAQGQVVLFFHANWCPTCIAINKDIETNNTNIPKDVTILKINYDDAKELKTLYGVTEQHTFVQVDNTGKLLKKWRGGATLTDVVSQVQK